MMKDDRLKTYVINLDTSVGRMITCRESLRELRLPFERISAFDARDLDLSACADYNAERSRAWFGEGVTNGEYGCHKSHLMAIRRFVDSDADYGLILEDDIKIAPYTRPILLEVLTFLKENPNPWHLFHLGRRPKICFRPIGSLPFAQKHIPVLQSYFLPYSAFALLWTRKGAELFLQETTEFLAPFDVWVSSWSGRRANTLALAKPPFAARFGRSDIDSATEHRSNRLIYRNDDPSHPANRRTANERAEASAKLDRGQTPM
jgi:glycosyl transferase, family 25